MTRTDEVGGRGVRIVQGERGVKASVDGLLLARFVRPEEHWRVADLGCGNGLVGLVMASEQPSCRVVGVELQEGLVHQAREGARINGLANISFVRADLRSCPWRTDLGRFELVAANPPYRKVGTGKMCPDPVRAAARYEVNGCLADFAAAASALLRDGCSSSWVYAASRRQDLVDALRISEMEAVRVRHVLSRAGEGPILVLVEAIKGGGVGAAWEEDPLVLFSDKTGNEYTDEAREWLYGDSSA